MKFNFLGRVISVEADGGGRIVTSQSFPQGEDYLESPFHPPSQVPATLILESMAASGGRLVRAVSGEKAFGLVVRVEEARFWSSVKAGEEVLVRSELLGIQDKSGESFGLARTRSQAFVGDEPVAEARIVFICVPVAGFGLKPA